jgi:hypothetical protein
MPTPSLRFSDHWSNGSAHETAMLDLRGRIAVSFAEHNGMIAAIQDGEDSSGRSKLRLQTPREVAERAIEVAKLLTEGMDALGWLHEVPVPAKEAD